MLGREIEDAETLDTPDGIIVKAGHLDGEPHLSFYTGRWERMLDVEKVRELASILTAWLVTRGDRR